MSQPDPTPDPLQAIGDSPTSTYTPQQPPAPAIQIDGYRAVREISRGGQGTVFEAIRLSTGRRVAVKVLGSGALSSARDRARFEQEARILGALDHPGIVQIIDRGTAGDGSMYLVMDYIAGRSLSQYLNERPRGEAPAARDPSETLRLFLKIADAVNAAHLRGIMHRDLKPANIIIDDHGEPHILDFGLARTGLVRYTDEPNPEPVTMTGQFLGSLPWSSPEQADGDVERMDIRSDVYSLGVILYQMLTGEFPYEVAGTMRDVLNNITTADPPPPSQVLEARAAREARRRMRLRVGSERLNATIDAIVLKALSKRREDRYQSAGELARDIANYLSGRPTMAVDGRAPQAADRRWWKLATAAAVLVLVGGGALIARPWLIGAPPPSRPDGSTISSPDDPAIQGRFPPPPPGAGANAWNQHPYPPPMPGQGPGGEMGPGAMGPDGQRPPPPDGEWPPPHYPPPPPPGGMHPPPPGQMPPPPPPGEW